MTLLFQNTYPATTLKKIIEMILGHLAHAIELGFAIRLRTGFGESALVMN
jgi:hypothetical protein